MASIQLSRYEAEEGDLPEVCMRCGAPATEWKRRRFVSRPLWVYLLLPLGFIHFPFGLIHYDSIAADRTVDVRCYTLFCSRHKNHWRFRTLIIWAAFVALLALIVGSFAIVGAMSEHVGKSTLDTLMGLLCIGSPVLAVCWLISIPIMQVTAIHPANVTERGLTLKRVSPAFAEALRNYRENRKRQMQQEDWGEFRPDY